MTTHESTRWAWLLGVAGLIPFVVPALIALAGKPDWLAAQHQYGACILAFLGAVHWGPALNRSAGKPAWLLAWGVVPSLMAWVIMVFVTAHTGAWLAAALLITLAADVMLVRFHSWPKFYIKLRCVLSVTAVACLLSPSV